MAATSYRVAAMFPIRDHNPSLRTPYVTYVLLALNIGIYLAGFVLWQTDSALSSLYYNYAMIPARIANGENYTSLITSVFLHGGFWHLAGNMLFLWIFGDNIEDKMGHIPFLIFYLAGGAAADLAQFAADPWSPVPTIGASGAIAAVMGGYLLLFPRAKIDILLIFIIFFRVFTIPAWVTLGLWFAFQLINGVASDVSGGGVAYWAHAGGFVIGIVFVLPLWLRLGGRAFWSQTDGHPDHPAAKYTIKNSRIPIVRRK